MSEIAPHNTTPPTWLGLTMCPDCGRGLNLVGERLCCSPCDREFSRLGRAYQLLPRGIDPATTPTATESNWKGRLIGNVYARHNRGRNVRQGLRRALSAMGEDCWALNIGGGGTAVHPRAINLDLCPHPQVDVLATAARLPFADASVDCVVSQEVFEHLADPDQAVREAARVLRPGGRFFLQVPFIIGFHSGPHDYWRFTDRGLEELIRRAGLETIEIGTAAGAGTAMYRIAVEFCASIAGALWRRMYLPAKGLAAVVLSPLRWLDGLLGEASDVNRISAGFFIISRKV